MKRQYDGTLKGRFFTLTALKAKNIKVGDEYILTDRKCREKIIKVEPTKTKKSIKITFENRVYGLIEMTYRANTLVPIEMRG